MKFYLLNPRTLLINWTYRLNEKQFLNNENISHCYEIPVQGKGKLLEVAILLGLKKQLILLRH